MSESKLIRSRSKNAFANNLNAEPNIKKDRNNNSSASNDFSRTYNKKNKKHQKNEKKSINPTPLVESYHSYHHVRDSLLSSSSGYTNYRGILNLCVVLLVMSTGRLVLENIMKYGFLVRFDIPIRFIKDPTAWPSLLVIVCKFAERMNLIAFYFFKSMLYLIRFQFIYLVCFTFGKEACKSN
jgi:hypothetical protein